MKTIFCRPRGPDGDSVPVAKVLLELQKKGSRVQIRYTEQGDVGERSTLRRWASGGILDVTAREDYLTGLRLRRAPITRAKYVHLTYDGSSSGFGHGINIPLECVWKITVIAGKW